MKRYILLGLALLLLVMPVHAANDKIDGFEQYFLDRGLVLLDYDVLGKYREGDDKLIILDIYFTDGYREYNWMAGHIFRRNKSIFSVRSNLNKYS